MARQLTEADALAAHARDELGLTEAGRPRPLQAAVTSALAFTVAALLPLVAYLVAPDGGRSAYVVGSALATLAILGALGATLGGGDRIRATARVAVGGALAMAVTMAIGELTGAAVG